MKPVEQARMTRKTSLINLVNRDSLNHSGRPKWLVNFWPFISENRNFSITRG